MNCYIIQEVGNDGYVKLMSSDSSYQKEMPIRSTKIMFESGKLLLANPELLYHNPLYSNA